MVKVAMQGLGVKEIEHRQDMTVEDLLKEAEMAASESSTITVNGKDAKKNSSVPDESVVVVTSKISNG